MLGTFSFAFSGAVAAMNRRLDVFGVLLMAFVTAIGGGTIRDLLIGSLPVAWLQHPGPTLTIIVAYMAAIFFHGQLYRYRKIFFWMDTFGLALFCVFAINKGIQFGLNPFVCISLGTITGCFGGVLRDVLMNEIPYIFKEDIYASACIAGGLIFFMVWYWHPHHPAANLLSALVIIIIRIGAEYRKWRLPLIYVNYGSGSKLL